MPSTFHMIHHPSPDSDADMIPPVSIDASQASPETRHPLDEPTPTIRLVHSIRSSPDEIPIYHAMQDWSDAYGLFETPKVPGSASREELFSIHLKEPFDSKAMHRAGKILLDGEAPLLIENVLFDSGANLRSYINRKFILAHYDLLSHLLKPIKGGVRLGDSKTVIKIEHSIVLTLEFAHSTGKTYRVTEEFEVLETGPDMIIGLPLIATQLREYFMSILVDLAPSLPRQPAEAEDETDFSALVFDRPTDGLDPFTPLDYYPVSPHKEEDAPEDTAIDHPHSYPDCV